MWTGHRRKKKRRGKKNPLPQISAGWKRKGLPWGRAAWVSCTPQFSLTAPDGGPFLLFFLPSQSATPVSVLDLECASSIIRALPPPFGSHFPSLVSFGRIALVIIFIQYLFKKKKQKEEFQVKGLAWGPNSNSVPVLGFEPTTFRVLVHSFTHSHTHGELNWSKYNKTFYLFIQRLQGVQTYHYIT